MIQGVLKDKIMHLDIYGLSHRKKEIGLIVQICPVLNLEADSMLDFRTCFAHEERSNFHQLGNMHNIIAASE